MPDEACHEDVDTVKTMGVGAVGGSNGISMGVKEILRPAASRQRDGIGSTRCRVLRERPVKEHLSLD